MDRGFEKLFKQYNFDSFVALVPVAIGKDRGQYDSDGKV